jgi:serine/threonine protein kinase/WD40 repeat protein
MHALDGCGRQADALRVYARYREHLADETGLEPSDALRSVEASILAGDRDQERAPGAPSMRGYTLGEVLGTGAFGTVYLATQPGVGREVAVKVIRAELADDPAFVRTFEAEAQLAANLEHPHIVPLHDFWREPGGAYLVFRYLRGGNAEQLLRETGAWSLDRVNHLVTQIGGALAAAHAAGVVHRDVKPANVLFDEAGNAYLADFGIAAAEIVDEPSGDVTASAGSPLYAPPEQFQRSPPSPRADQYSFAAMVWELLTGDAPFSGGSASTILRAKLDHPVPSLRGARPDLTADLDAVLQRATASRAAERFDAMDALLVAWNTAVQTAAATTSDLSETSPSASTTRDVVSTVTRLPATIANPYKGLRPFGEADARHFHGRDVLAAQLTDKVRRHTFVAVVGPSGSGKSSLLHAGLVPRLRAVGMRVATMRPDADSCAHLRNALLAVALRPPAADGIASLFRSVASEADAPLVLVIDQLEELWTLANDVDRERFLAGIAELIGDSADAVRVVAGIRADFFDRPLAHPALGSLVAANTFGVTPMTASELHDAVVEPAAACGAVFEPGLAHTLVADVADQPASLPMLQFTLAELFDRRRGSVISPDVYDAIGGLAGAIATRAEEQFARLDAPGREATRRLLLRLVVPGDGTEDTRRRVRYSELPDGTEDVAARYTAQRLLVADRDSLTREPTIEIAHESLLRTWPRLRSWLDEDRDALRRLHHIGEAAAAWNAAGRPESELYRGARLDAANELVAVHPDELTVAEREFVAASAAASHATRERERLTRRRLRRGLIATAVALVIALVAGTIAVVQRNRANNDASAARRSAAAARVATRVAEVRLLVSESHAQLTGDRQLATLLALEADRLEPSADTRDALLKAVMSEPGLQRTFGGTVWTIGALTDHRVAVLTADGTSQVWDWQTGRQLPWPDAPPAFTSTGGTRASAAELGSSHDGSLLAVLTRGGMIQLYSGRTLRHIGTPFSSGLGDPPIFSSASVVFSSDGRTLAVADGTNTPTPAHGDSLRVFFRVGDAWVAGPHFARHPTQVNFLAFSRDGRVLASMWPAPNGGPNVEIDDVHTGRHLYQLEVVGNFSLALDWDRRRLVTDQQTGGRGDAVWYDLHTTPPTPHVLDAGLNPDSCCSGVSYDWAHHWLAVEGGLGLGLFDETSLERRVDVPVVPVTNEGEFALAFPDADHVVLGGATTSGPMNVWSLRGVSPLAEAAPAPYDSIEPSSLPNRFFGFVDLGAPNASVTLLDASLRRVGPPIRADRATPAESAEANAVPNVWRRMAACVDPVSGRIATISLSTGDVVIHDGSPPFRELRRMAGHPASSPTGCAWRPGGRQLAVTTGAAAAFEMLYDIEHGSHIEGAAPIAAINPMFAPDGRELWFSEMSGVLDRVTGLDGTPDVETPFADTSGAGDDATAAALTHDGQRIVVVGHAWLESYDARSLRPISKRLPLPGSVIDAVAVSADGHEAVVSRAEGMQLVDLDALQTIGPVIRFPSGALAYFGAAGSTIYVVSTAGGTIWNFDPSRVGAVACALAGRNLSNQEWRHYMAWAGSRTATCAQYSLT